MLLLLLLFSTSAKATDYVSDVMFVGDTDDSKVESLVKKYEKQGWTRISRDLNDGAKGDYIYLLYKKESSNGQNYDFITDFYIRKGSNAPDELTYKGRTYHLVTYDGRDHFKNQKGDLNSGTGEKTDAIHLYYTRDYFSNDQVVTGIDFSITQKSGALGVDGGSEGYDLNSGAGGLYIYMHVLYGTAKAELLGDGTAQNCYQINNDKDWLLFARDVKNGKSDGKYYYQNQDINVEEPVGTSEHPFGGFYFGNHHKLNLTIISNEDFPAPFRYVRNAAIRELNTDGLVTYVGSGNGHSGGLVGWCSEVAYIEGCTVSGAVLAYNKYCGGIVGHAGSSYLLIENSVFDGTVGSFKKYAGGLVGWYDSAQINLYNCMVAGTFNYIEPGMYHPIACTYGDSHATGQAFDVYYLNTIGKKYDDTNVVPGVEGIPVSDTRAENSWDELVQAPNGKSYYAAHPDGPKKSPYTFGFEQLGGWTVVNGYNKDGATTGITNEDADRGLCSFKFVECNQDQYLISPELDGRKLQYFTFRLRGTADKNIRFKIGVSTKTNNPEDFSWGNENNLKLSSWKPCEATTGGPVKYVAIKYLAGGSSLWIDNFYFKETGTVTPENLSVSDITTGSAKLQWESNADSYTIRYRSQAYSEDFEGSVAWGLHNEGGNENTGWQIVNIGTSHSGSRAAMTSSYDMINRENTTTYSVDNWLVMPQVQLGGKLSYWLFPSHNAFCYHEILVSTTDLHSSSFTTIATPTLDHPELANSERWEQITVDLSELAGKAGYIAFRMKDEGTKFMIIDDITVSSDWVTVNTTDPSLLLTGLAAGTTYEVQVQGHKGDDTTDWSDATTFTTLPSEDTPDAIKVITIDELGMNTWFDLLGRRMNAKPSTPGLYINKGKKILKK